MRKFKAIMLANLLLTLLSGRPLMAQDLDLNPIEQENLAERIKSGEECALNLSSINMALAQCGNDLEKTRPSFFQKPEVEIAGFVVTISATLIIVCATHAMGACR